MMMSLRPAKESDIDFARAVHHSAYYDVAVAQFGPWDELAQDRFFEEGWSALPHRIVLCDGVACGYTCIDDSADQIRLRELVIHPEFQNRGVGSAVIVEILVDARARGIPVRLGTCHMNRAQELYTRLGFRETGRDQTHIHMEWSPD
jgi:ribosomal protein S18 acetylase RimI-like enzyme